MKNTSTISLILFAGLVLFSNAQANDLDQLPAKEYLCQQDFFAETGEISYDLPLLFIRVKKNPATTDGGYLCTLGHSGGSFVGRNLINAIYPCVAGIDGNKRLEFEAEEQELDLHIVYDQLVSKDENSEDEGDAKGPTQYYAAKGTIKMTDSVKKYYELVRHQFKCEEAKGDVLKNPLWKI